MAEACTGRAAATRPHGKPLLAVWMAQDDAARASSPGCRRTRRRRRRCAPSRMPSATRAGARPRSEPPPEPERPTDAALGHIAERSPRAAAGWARRAAARCSTPTACRRSPPASPRHGPPRPSGARLRAATVALKAIAPGVASTRATRGGTARRHGSGSGDAAATRDRRLGAAGHAPRRVRRPGDGAGGRRDPGRRRSATRLRAGSSRAPPAEARWSCSATSRPGWRRSPAPTRRR